MDTVCVCGIKVCVHSRTEDTGGNSVRVWEEGMRALILVDTVCVCGKKVCVH